MTGSSDTELTVLEPGQQPRFQRQYLNQASRSFVWLSTGMGLIAMFLPIILVAIGGYTGSWSISYFYHVPATRDVLVGSLCALGVFLVVFQAFKPATNWLLNVAGAAIILVALVPMEDATCRNDGSFEITTHFVSAVVFFLCIATVAIFFSKSRIVHIVSEPKRRFFSLAYTVSGVSMVLLPALVLILNQFFQTKCENSAVFWAESFAIWSFASFWLVKTYEYRTLLGAKYIENGQF